MDIQEGCFNRNGHFVYIRHSVMRSTAVVPRLVRRTVWRDDPLVHEPLSSCSRDRQGTLSAPQRTQMQIAAFHFGDSLFPVLSNSGPKGGKSKGYGGKSKSF
eukprot:6294259-Amphidinium_carterae.1